MKPPVSGEARGGAINYCEFSLEAAIELVFSVSMFFICWRPYKRVYKKQSGLIIYSYQLSVYQAEPERKGRAQ